MARDPPSLLSATELRDLPLKPSAIRSARVTIIHPQLRDLILPLERGNVLYPQGKSIQKLSWQPDEDDQLFKTTTTRTFAELSFTPNCLTMSGSMFACGGQHGEIFMRDLNLPSRIPSRLRQPPAEEFTLSVSLPSHAINNSIVILPTWPRRWARRQVEHRAKFHGCNTRQCPDDEIEYGKMTANEPSLKAMREDEQVSYNEDNEDEEVGDEEDDDDEDTDQLMEIDDEDDMSLSSSVATYPNTVPFLHAPRIPYTSTSSSRTPQSRSGRHSSFGSIDRPFAPVPRATRYSFSSTIDRPGLPPVEFVTSRPRNEPGLTQATNSRSPSLAFRRRFASDQDGTLGRSCEGWSGGIGTFGRRRRRGVEEPRILISNNDQTVKVLTLRPAHEDNTALSTSSDRLAEITPLMSAVRRTATSGDDAVIDPTQPTRSQFRMRRERGSETLPPPLPHFGSSLGFDSIGLNEGIRAQTEELEELVRRVESRRQERRLLREDLERRIGIAGGENAAGNGAGASVNAATTVRTAPTDKFKLGRIGGAKFRLAVNHSSLSPDLRHMVTVGDSTDVFLFEVLEGGKDFRKIGVYRGATDSGFSTSWSKDGRKFAVASQDGQVTVWDHRSSHPLAIFHTTPSTSPSFGSEMHHVSFGGLRLSPQGWGSSSSPIGSSGDGTVLIDPVTGDARTGTSTSGLEAARVVKFSPEGSDRDLMVFSEENTNIHLVDAKTFNTHVVIPVPSNVPGEAPGPTRRTGNDSGAWGIAGVGFDPSGQWLYSGTERTVVEWDLRRYGGGEGGTWAMA